MSEAKLMREFWIALSVILTIAAGILFFYLKSRNKYAGPKVKAQKFAKASIARKSKDKHPKTDSEALEVEIAQLNTSISETEGILAQNLSLPMKTMLTAQMEAEKKRVAQLEIELKSVLEQEKQTADAVVDDKGRPLPPNCVILRSKKLGGIKYEYVKPELIPLESYKRPTEWLNHPMHWLVSDGFNAAGQEQFKVFEAPDEIEQYPAKLLDTIKATPIKEFLKLDKGILEKVAVWACVAVILGCMFIGFVTVTQPKQVKASTGQLTPVTQPVLTPINSTTTTTTTTITTGGK